MGVAVHSQEVEIELGQSTHCGFNCRADVEQFHIKEDAFAVFLDQLVCQRQTTSGQHTQTDFVEVDRITDLLGHFQSRVRVWNV